MTINIENSYLLAPIRKIVLITVLMLGVEDFCFAQETIYLQINEEPDRIECADEERFILQGKSDTMLFKVSTPTLSVFLPENRDSIGSSVIIFPGGGYQSLLITHEGYNIARHFNKLGIPAFVVKYRLPDDRISTNKSTLPFRDAQQAIKIVREHAQEWNIDPDKIGVMGFSAGGHLASTIGTHSTTSWIDNDAKTSLVPNFMILINPVISFTDSIGHIGSRRFLLGNEPTEGQISFFSNEYHVTQNTPPTFLVHTTNDEVVSVKNSLYFYNQLIYNQVPTEMHLYSKGEHGLLTAPPFEEWFGRCMYWLKSVGLMQRE